MATWAEQAKPISEHNEILLATSSDRRNNFTIQQPSWGNVAKESVSFLVDDAPLLVELNLQSKWGM